MNNYHLLILNFLKRIGILLIVYSLCRILFFAFNYHTFSHNSFLNYFELFIVGIRFDLIPISVISLPLMIIALLPFNFIFNRRYQQIIGILFMVFNIGILLFNFIDIAYFSMTSKRTTADAFSLVFVSKDVSNLLPQLIRDYWYVPLLWITSSIATVYFIVKYSFKFPDSKPLGKKSLLASIEFLFLVGLLFLSIRGTGYKPIMVQNAMIYTKSENVPLILNTPFSIYATIQSRDLKRINYLNEKDVINYIGSPEHNLSFSQPQTNKNVVILVLESFSKQFVGGFNNGNGYTPFLDSLMTKSLVFDNAYANQCTSMEAIPVILASIPAIFDDAYIASHYSTNHLEALPGILANHGYHTSFFHGAENGSMGFDLFCHAAGVQHYYGKNEFDGSEGFDGNWGIRDEEFLQFASKKIATFPKPFFSCIFTLSSHHPYVIPNKYKNKFKAKGEPIHRAIQYTDYSLRQFFKTIQSESWFKNTLFVIVADHAFQNEEQYGNKLISNYKIPLIFYSPSDKNLIGRNSVLAQQLCIMPTVLNYLRIPGKAFYFGDNLFDKNNDPFVVNYSSGTFKTMSKDYVFTFSDNKKGLYNVKTDSLTTTNLMEIQPETAKNLENKTKAFIQQYYNRLIDNKLFY